MTIMMKMMTIMTIMTFYDNYDNDDHNNYDPKKCCHLSGPTEPEAEERGRQQRGREGRPSTCCVQCIISKIKSM